MSDMWFDHPCFIQAQERLNEIEVAINRAREEKDRLKAGPEMDSICNALDRLIDRREGARRQLEVETQTRRAEWLRRTGMRQW